jgi:pimeloyl-ACP methyl ester carboxylesterase
MGWGRHVCAEALFVALESVSFAFSENGLRLLVASTSLGFLAQNPSGFGIALRRSAGVILLGRCAYSLGTLIKQRKNRRKQLESIWDWEPPRSEGATTWFVLKELVATFNSLKQEYPEVDRYLQNTPDLAQKIYYFMMANESCGQIRAAECDGTSVDRLSPDDLSGLQLLRQYRQWCICAYDCTDDAQLEANLQGSFSLIGSKTISDDKSPAYYLAVRPGGSHGRETMETMETMLCLRGTYSGEDVITDMIATGVSFEDGIAHSGMARAAEYLFARFSDFLTEAAVQGQVTIVGHSLGAGVAALLTYKLKRTGVDRGLELRVRCLAYEPPACMNRHMAENTLDHTWSLVNRDDLVPRLAPTPVVNLLHRLHEFDWETAAEKDSNGMVKMLGRLLAAGDARPKAGRALPIESGYDPFVPGRVLYVCPGEKPVPLDQFDSRSTLRTLQLTLSMIRDHFIDTDEMSAALTGTDD